MQPINLIFRFLNHKSRVCIWLVEQNQVRPYPTALPLAYFGPCAAASVVRRTDAVVLQLAPAPSLKHVFYDYSALFWSCFAAYLNCLFIIRHRLAYVTLPSRCPCCLPPPHHPCPSGAA
jgi:hypothetical protein